MFIVLIPIAKLYPLPYLTKPIKYYLTIGNIIIYIIIIVIIIIICIN